MSSITAKTKMCIIIGDPVEHSLSPAMHNAAYKHLGIDREFVFTAAHVKPGDVKYVVQAVRAMGIRGLTCTIPHKIEVMQYLDEIDEVAQKIGAVNTVVNHSGRLKGYNTDWLGTVCPIEQVTSLKDKRVALIGAGGAARAMAYGVVARGAALTIYNRTIENAQLLAAEINDTVKTAHISTLQEPLDDIDIIINATSVGMGDQAYKTPISN